MPLRTGYERVLAHRTDDLYAKTARADGKVVDVTDKVIKVQYDDGEAVAYELGRRYGNWSGHVVPHALKSARKKGDVVKQGDPLLYNANFFQVDKLDPTQVIYKSGVLARTALLESSDTIEDSSAISEALAKQLATTATHVRVVKIAYEQEVRNLLKVGEAVDVESILCTIENPAAGRSDFFDEQALETLKLLSSLTPKAKSEGVIERIEVLYSGELDEMSESLKLLAERSDAAIYKLHKQLGKPAVTGKVAVGFRIDGVPLEQDTVAIKIYITGNVPAGQGD